MNIKITSQVLSILPFLSTTWSNIVTLKPEMAGEHYTLSITLKSGERVLIPQLAESDVRQILEAHAQYTEAPQTSNFPLPFTFSLPLKTEGSLHLNDSMHHNAEQSNLPEIPSEILNKMAILAKAFGLDHHANLEPAVAGCNCIYCQLRNVLSPPEELIKDEELSFRDWEVKEMAHNFYEVTSPLDKNEQYNVFLGDPIGCTCGQNHCEHIKAVLHS